MSLATLRQLLDYAAEQGSGVRAFSITDMEQGLAVMNPARACDAPAVLQASLNVRRTCAGDRMIVAIVNARVGIYPDDPICLHRDHGHDEQVCVSALAAGFTSVMMDGSLMAGGKTPVGFAHNVDITAPVAQMAHWTGASIEGELGVLRSLETGESGEEDGSGATGKLQQEQPPTDPDQAAEFVAVTKVDALAIACGTSHGAHKVTRQIEAIRGRVPCIRLVMHGSRSVPQHSEDPVNAFAGEMPQTWGVLVEEIERGIRRGVRKVNIDTDCRMAVSGAMRRFAREDSASFDPREFILSGMGEMDTLVRDRFGSFVAAGHGRKIKPVPMADMARRYADRTLDPRREAACAGRSS